MDAINARAGWGWGGPECWLTTSFERHLQAARNCSQAANKNLATCHHIDQGAMLRASHQRRHRLLLEFWNLFLPESINPRLNSRSSSERLKLQWHWKKKKCDLQMVLAFATDAASSRYPSVLWPPQPQRMFFQGQLRKSR